MSVEAQYQEKSGYLLVILNGQWTEDAARQVIDKTKDEAKARGFTRLLMDVRELLPPANEMARFFTGEYIARILRAPFRTATLSQPELINRFAENIAVNRGAHLAAFTDLDAALKWLLEESSSSARGDT